MSQGLNLVNFLSIFPFSTYNLISKILITKIFIEFFIVIISSIISTSWMSERWHILKYPCLFVCLFVCLNGAQNTRRSLTRVTTSSWQNLMHLLWEYIQLQENKVRLQYICFLIIILVIELFSQQNSLLLGSLRLGSSGGCAYFNWCQEQQSAT